MREKQPESLKAQFRMITRIVPDKRLIMRAKLASSDLETLEDRSETFSPFYHLCREQISNQVQYDWRPRNILSILDLGKELRAWNPNQEKEPRLVSLLGQMND